MTAKKKLPTIELVYLGAFITSKGKLGYQYRTAADGKLGDEPITFSKKLTSHAGVGEVYRYEHSRPNDVLLIHGHGERVRRWHDRTQAERWQVEHQAERDEHASKTSAKAAGKERLDHDALESWRQAYAAANSTRRNLILMRAVQFITKGT